MDPFNAFDPVMAGEVLIEEAVIGVDEIGQEDVFLDGMSDETMSFLEHRILKSITVIFPKLQ